ncbi:MAG: class I SAM-dependent methyltransferase, partial [Bacteroidales bacterium]|nr:class I SAM-dependent methyltransferase [Bacteroidales bacterium]
MEKLQKNDYIHGGTQKDFYNENEREFCSCPLCGNDKYFQLYTERGLSVVKCKNCDLIYTNPRAKNAEENYFGDASVFYNEAMLIFKGKKAHHRDKNYEYELKKIKKIKKCGKLLDVGTNMGFFLRKARDVGFEVEGVEPSPSLSKIARENWGLKIHTSFLEKADLPNNNYDIITLIDVFEHVTNPKELLKVSYILLKPDGIIAIKVPNGDYNYFKMKFAKAFRKAKNMDIWDCYEHVVHYTPKTFAKMVESCGFKVKTSFIPLPIHTPIWANLVGHYYQYPSPFILDWKRIILRNLFYRIGKIEYWLTGKSNFG